jgi:predicted nucleotidyltransferase component of viral defense system
VKDYLTQLIRSAQTPAQARGVTREYLQARILGALQRMGAMIPLAFHGGTALRFLYASARYSEDLDFALEKDQSRYDFRAYLQAIRSELTPEGYVVELKVSDQRAVHSAFVRFPGLLNDLGLSPHRSEVLAVKIEVDTNPPQGAVLATTVVRRHATLQLQHHDRASLLAGKLHAVLRRPYVKGRDLYDLIWYLSDPGWPPPNLTLLNNALKQTGWAGDPLTDGNWHAVVRERVKTVAWDLVADDVRPFLEPEANPSLLTSDNLSRLLERSATSRFIAES